MSASSKDYTVSKSHPTVASVLKQVLPEWSGKEVRVRLVGPDWTHTQYEDDTNTKAYYAVDGGGKLSFTVAERPKYGGGTVIHRVSLPNQVLVIWQRFQGEDVGVELIAQAGGLDVDAIEVAADMIDSGDERRATTCLMEACGGRVLVGSLLHATAQEYNAERVRKAKSEATKAAKAAK